MRPIAAALVLLALAAVPALAQEDAEGCKDHPMFSRMPGFFITACEDQEFSAFEFDTPDRGTKVEGHYWRLDFEIREGAKTPGPLQIGRNFWNPMAARGGKRLFEDLDPGGGTMVATMPGPKSGAVWVQVNIANGGEMFTLHVVQEQGMRQDVEMSAADMADALARTGSLTLTNILFDTGKATLKPESSQVLGTVLELLGSQPTLVLEIQGHTDNVGGKDANLKLSRDRAEAVKAHLVAGGVAAGRLATAGFGDSRPVGDNATEAGRAANRRVVLVKKS